MVNESELDQWQVRQFHDFTTSDCLKTMPHLEWDRELTPDVADSWRALIVQTTLLVCAEHDG